MAISDKQRKLAMEIHDDMMADVQRRYALAALERLQLAASRLTDNLNEFGHVTDDVFVDDVMRACIAAREILAGPKK